MNNHLFYCCYFHFFSLFYVSWNIDIILADRLELFTSITLSWKISLLSRQRTTKALIRLRGCADWSAPLLFIYDKNEFSHDVAHFRINRSYLCLTERKRVCCILFYGEKKKQLGPVKRICVFEHSVITNFNCACPAIQRGQGTGFLSEGSSWLTARIGDKYQIRLTRSIVGVIFCRGFIGKKMLWLRLYVTVTCDSLCSGQKVF